MADKIKVYVAGPITVGDQLANVGKAIEVADYLLSMGFYPFCPHAMSVLWHITFPRTWDEWLDYDEAWVACCDAVFRMPGESRGADRECAFAREMGIPVFHATEELTRHFLKGVEVG